MPEYAIYLIVGASLAAGLAFIPAYPAKDKGYSFGVWWLYGWALFIVAIIHVNLIPDMKNQNANNSTPVDSLKSAHDMADALKKLKELKDQGVITEEEFQTKKEQYLKLM